VFASCSTDRTIAVCALSDIQLVPDSSMTTTTPIQVLVGHADEVNAIRWDPSGKLLASCSDDHNVFVWQLGQSEGRVPSNFAIYEHPILLGRLLCIALVIMPRKYTPYDGLQPDPQRAIPMFFAVLSSVFVRVTPD